MRKEDFEEELIESIIKSVNLSIDGIKFLNDSSINHLGVPIPNGALSRIFHDSILFQLKRQNNFGNALDKISDFSYKGERWELKTSRTKNDVGINAVNILEKVKILIVNSIPEKGQIFQIRILDSRDRYFNQNRAGTQIRTLNEEGKSKTIKIYP